jgi:uncharacterized protein (DUF2252 family)
MHPRSCAAVPIALTHPTRAHLALLSAAALLGACDPDEAAARRSWLHTTLVLDNQVFLETEPELTGGKLAAMASDPYAYFRGSVGQYARDLAQAGAPGYLPTAYLPAEAADVALVGDPHLENIGTYRPAEGPLVLEFNDFDAATYGPYHYDVRRLALSIAVAGRVLALDEAAQGAAVLAALRGYTEEIARLADGAPPAAILSDEPDLADYTILRDLFKKADEDGGAREELADYTAVEFDEDRGAHVRRFQYGEVEPPRVWRGGAYEQQIHEDALAPTSADDRWIIGQVMRSYPATLAAPLLRQEEHLAIKGVARRLGAGVASYPVRRYYVLIEGPTAEVDDDQILELKQIFDPMLVPGMDEAARPRFTDNGQRTLTLQRALQSGPAVDPLFGVGHAGGLRFRVRERTKYQRGLDLARIAERLADGRFSAGDVAELTRWAGVLLARSHARAPKHDGRPAAPAIAAAIAADPEGFLRETIDFVAAYAPVLDQDYAHLGALLADYGPHLGYFAR